MKQTNTITLCGVCAALATALMLGAYFPYLTYAVPALAGAVLLIPLYECGKKQAFMAFLASVLPVVLLCEKEAALLYGFWLGYYPCLKAVLERLPSRLAEYLLKFLCFNVACTAAYALGILVLGLPREDLMMPLRYGLPLLYLLANVTFLLYDVCLTRLAAYYGARLHRHLARLFRNR